MIHHISHLFVIVLPMLFLCVKGVTPAGVSPAYFGRNRCSANWRQCKKPVRSAGNLSDSLGKRWRTCLCGERAWRVLLWSSYYTDGVFYSKTTDSDFNSFHFECSPFGSVATVSAYPLLESLRLESGTWWYWYTSPFCSQGALGCGPDLCFRVSLNHSRLGRR